MPQGFPLRTAARRLAPLALSSLLLTLSSPASATLGPLRWSHPKDIDPWPTSVPNEPGLVGISCPSASACVGVDLFGHVVISTDPAAGARSRWTRYTRFRTIPEGIDCPSTSLCYVYASNALVVSRNPFAGSHSQWTRTAFPVGVGVTDLSCVGTSLCVAVGDYYNPSFADGVILATTDPLGTATSRWSVVYETGTNIVQAVSCATTSLCVAVSRSITYTSLTPSAGQLGAWTVGSADASSASTITAISCPSSSLCVGVGDRVVNNTGHAEVFASTDPSSGTLAAWVLQQVRAGSQLAAVSCSLPHNCVAVGTGAGVTSTAPSFVGTWVPTDVGMLSGNSVSCPTVAFCGDVDGGDPYLNQYFAAVRST